MLLATPLDTEENEDTMTRQQSQARRDAHTLAERKRHERTTQRRAERAAKIRARENGDK